MTYVDSESIQVRTCVNGTLYSLIKRQSIKEVALNNQIDVILNQLLNSPNDQMKKQLQYILEELSSETSSEEKDEEDVNDIEEEDELIDEEYVSGKYLF